MVKGRIKTSIILAIWFVLTAIWSIVAVFTDIHHVSSFSYMALALFWTISLGREITEPFIKRCLQTGGVMLFLLFLLRFLRYLDMNVPVIDRMLWYAYYVPFLLLPMLSFEASIHIGGADQAVPAVHRGISDFLSRKDLHRNRMVGLVLISISVVFGLLCLSNDLHHLLMTIRYTDTEYTISYHLFYYIIFVWSAVLPIAAFIILIRRCRITSYKKYMALPIVVGSIGFLLWGWYYVRGGSSPRIMGLSLYNIQEVFLLLFIGVWESCILIGLIPTRSLISERDWIRKTVLSTIREEYISAREYYDGLFQKEEDDFREALIRMACIGAYVKRRTNLELIADSRGLLSSTELSLAIRETFDYHQIAGLSTGYEESGKAEVPALLIIYAYELFEKILRQARSACYVMVSAGQTADEVHFRMIVEADAEDPEEGEGTENAFLDKVIREMGAPESIGARITVREEDETETVELSAAYPLKVAWFTRFEKHEKYAEHGLAGIAGFLSLEGEALRVKTWIHDSLGRCLLMAKRYILCPGEVERDALYKAWDRSFGGIIGLEEGAEPDAALLPESLRHQEQVLREGTPVSSLDQAGLMEVYPECYEQAESMGVRLLVTGRIPLDPRYLEIIETAISVHVTNVSDHTTGDEAYIHVTEDADQYVFVFENNGESRSLEVRETGGLRNLRRRTEAAGGSMVIESKPRFRMTLRLKR